MSSGVAPEQIPNNATSVKRIENGLSTIRGGDKAAGDNDNKESDESSKNIHEVGKNKQESIRVISSKFESTVPGTRYT